MTHQKNPQRLCGFCQPRYPHDKNIMGRLRKRTGEVVVHKENCPHLIGDDAILLPMSWQLQPAAFRISFFMVAQDRKGLIFDLTRQLYNFQCDLIKISAEATKFGEAHIRFTLETHSEREVLELWQAVLRIDSVVKAEVDAAATSPSILHRLQTFSKQYDTTEFKAIPSDLVWTESMDSLPPRNITLFNPFNISRPATEKMFFGRLQETTKMQEILCDSEQGKALVLYGPLRSGKTSICANFINNHVHYPFWGILHSLQNASWQDEESIFIQLAEKICLKFNETFQQTALNWNDCTDNDPQIRFRRIIQNCVAQVPGARLILALDEFGGALESYQSGNLAFRFFTFWKELMSEIPQLSLIFVLPTSGHTILSSKSFINVFSFTQSFNISFLDRISAQMLLVDPLKEQHILIHPTTVALALNLTGGNPYYITLLGQRLIEQLNQDMSIQLVTDRELRAVAEQIIEESAPYNFDFIKKELQNREEFLVLEGIVEITSSTRESKIRSKQIAAWLNKPISLTRKHLARLRIGSILNEIGPSSNPYYSFKVELIRRWLIRNRWFFSSFTDV